MALRHRSYRRLKQGDQAPAPQKKPHRREGILPSLARASALTSLQT